MIPEPKRLRLTEQGSLRAGLDAAHAGLPRPEQLEALAQRLRQAGVALPLDVHGRGFDAGAAIGAPLHSGGLSLLVRVGLALVIAGVGALPWLLREPSLTAVSPVLNCEAPARISYSARLR